MRERQGDVEVLAQYFLDPFALETPAFEGKTLSPATLSLLRRHRFPGNVRELKNMIERAAYRDTTSEITPGGIGLSAEADEFAFFGGNEQLPFRRRHAVENGGGLQLLFGEFRTVGGRDGP